MTYDAIEQRNQTNPLWAKVLASVKVVSMDQIE